MVHGRPWTCTDPALWHHVIYDEVSVKDGRQDHFSRHWQKCVTQYMTSQQVHRGTVTQLPRPWPWNCFSVKAKAKAAIFRPKGQAKAKISWFFHFFKIAAGGHLGFLNSANLNSWNVQRAKMLMYVLNFVKIGQTIAETWRFFDFSRWQPAAILDFQISLILTADELRDPRCITVPNFIKIDKAVVGISWFFHFSRWRPSAILDLFVEFLDHPQSIFSGLYWCTKFGWIPRRSFNNMKVWIFHAFGLKMPIYAPAIRKTGST